MIAMDESFRRRFQPPWTNNFSYAGVSSSISSAAAGFAAFGYSTKQAADYLEYFDAVIVAIAAPLLIGSVSPIFSRLSPLVPGPWPLVPTPSPRGLSPRIRGPPA